MNACKYLWILTTLCLIASVTARADDIHWVGYQYGPPQNPPLGASWFHGDQWFNYLVPSADDTAIFDIGFDPQDNGMPRDVYFGDFTVPADLPAVPTAFTVSGGDAQVGRIRIVDGDFTFHMTDGGGSPQGSLAVAEDIRIGNQQASASLTLVDGQTTSNYVALASAVGTADLILQDATLITDQMGLFDIGIGGGRGSVSVAGNSLLDAGYTRVGENDGSIGLLEIFGAQARAEVNGMQIGATGTGRMEIREGASLLSANSIQLGVAGTHSHGEFILSENGSIVSIEGDIVAGASGEGDVTIRSGAALVNASAFVGSQQVEGIGTGSILVEGEGSTWTSSGEVNIGHFGHGSLTIRDGADVIGTFFSAVGRASTGVGEVLVSGEGSTWTTGIEIGESGHATLTIADGGKVFSRGGDIGKFADSVGVVDISGMGSQLVVDSPGADDFQIANGGNGTLVVSEGASFSHHHGNTTISRVPGGTGMVVITGLGSSWESDTLYIASGDSTSNANMTVEDNASAMVASFVLVGNDGLGTLDVRSGGSLHSDSATIGQSATAQGAASVSGAGSRWTIDTNLTVGDEGTGSLSVLNGAVVEAQSLRVGPHGLLSGDGTIIGDVVVDGGTVSPGASPGALHITGNYHQLPDSLLSLQIGGTTPGAEFDQLLVSGDLVLEGMVQVAFIDGFVPHVGDTFSLLSAGGNFVPPAMLDFLNAPTAFDFSTTITDGVLSVTVNAVPEPSTAILLVAGLVAVGPYRRHRDRYRDQGWGI
jgi:T5SS/PEP-CTERM-associated repeat protein